MARTERTCTWRGSQRGVTLPEILAVVGIAAVILTIGIPLTAAKMRQVALNRSVSEFTMTLKAARMLAATRQAPVDVTVSIAAETYQYTDNQGRLRQFSMPEGVDITASTSPITFQPNGSVTGGANTVIEAPLQGGGLQRFTVATSNIGVSTVTHEKNP